MNRTCIENISMPTVHGGVNGTLIVGGYFAAEPYLNESLKKWWSGLTAINFKE
ncbi:MAG: hypothetical protein VYA30_05425 [Myxococcota bacterium]|nr:hypothetical protein [Myxococcota bacterium]